MGTYFQEVSNTKVATAELTNTGSCVCPFFEKKTPKAWKKSQTSNPQMFYIFEVLKIEQIFDFLLKEKFIKLPIDHKIPTIEELKGKDYYKYHNSYSHSTNACWAFKNISRHGISRFL